MSESKSPVRRRSILPSVAVLVAAATLWGCSSGMNRPVQEVTARTESDGVQHVTITTHSFWFEPNRVVVKRGVPVELKVHNGSWIVPHGFACHAAEAGLQLHAHLGMFSRTKKVQFTPKEAGEYPFACPVGSHAKKGMTGMLVVQ